MLESFKKQKDPIRDPKEREKERKGGKEEIHKQKSSVS